MPHTGILHTAASNGSQTHPTAAGAPLFRLLLATAGLFAALTHAAPALAGPVVCTTTLEAPVANAAPVEMTRCGRVQTVPELVTRRFYSYTAPFERGVSLTNQVTDFFGIAMGGGDGSRVMGLGFPCFTTSLADTSCSGARLAPKLSSYGYGVPGADPYGRTSYSGGGAASEPGGTVRGLW